MSTLEELKAEAAELYPAVGAVGPKIHTRVALNLERAAHIRAKTITAEQVEKAAEAMHGRIVDAATRGPIDIYVHQDGIEFERDLARAALEAAGCVIEEGERIRP